MQIKELKNGAKFFARKLQNLLSGWGLSDGETSCETPLVMYAPVGLLCHKQIWKFVGLGDCLQ